MPVIVINTRQDFERRAPVIRKVLESHGVIAFPTDTVNGIGCSPYDETAIRRVIALKQRDSEKGLAVLAADRAAAERIAIMNEEAARLADRFWPGALTLLLPLRDAGVSPLVAYNGLIAVRVPKHLIATLVAEAFGGCVVGTSANLSGKAPIEREERIAEELDVDLTIKSRTAKENSSSTIYDVRNMKVIRQGPVSAEEIEQALKR